MRAVNFNEYGGPEVLQVGDVGEPHPGPGQVRIAVRAAGVNPIDWKERSGALREFMPVEFPRVVGREAAGVVDEVGDGVTGVSPGDEVFGFAVGGAAAEEAVLDDFAGKPAGASFEEAAGLPVAVETSVRVFNLLGGLSEGQTIVINGAAGGVGSAAVQLAKARGARVIGITRSAEKRAMAEKLGADVTIPGGDNVIEQVRDLTEGRGADLAIETTGVLRQLENSVHMTRFGGKVLMFGIYTAKEGALPFYDLYFKEVSLISARVAKPEDYTACIALVERGQVKLDPLVSDVLPLGELKAAIGLLGSDSGQRMKIIMEHS
jgi:NADPH:quinone reductase-like Zn-dependent oxidoreductase